MAVSVAPNQAHELFGRDDDGKKEQNRDNDAHGSNLCGVELLPQWQN